MSCAARVRVAPDNLAGVVDREGRDKSRAGWIDGGKDVVRVRLPRKAQEQAQSQQTVQKSHHG
jgi:hypothetical protein